jgi:5-formyltetrahydrofolate cyclo-ligase
MASIETEKKETRHRLKTTLAFLSDSYRIEASHEIMKAIENWDLWPELKSLVVFRPMESEPQIQSLFGRARDRGCELGLVRTTGQAQNADTRGVLSVHQWSGDDSELVLNETLGLLEPRADAPLAKPEGIVFVPGLGFDFDGRRLGRGLGWYDTFLAAHPELFRIGICFASQIRQSIPVEAHDQQMDAIACEDGIIECRRESIRETYGD